MNIDRLVFKTTPAEQQSRLQARNFISLFSTLRERIDMPLQRLLTQSLFDPDRRISRYYHISEFLDILVENKLYTSREAAFAEIRDGMTLPFSTGRVIYKVKMVYRKGYPHYYLTRDRHLLIELPYAQQAQTHNKAG